MSNIIFTFLANTNPIFYLHVLISITSIIFTISCFSRLNRMYHADILGNRFQKESSRDQQKELLENSR